MFIEAIHYKYIRRRVIICKIVIIFVIKPDNEKIAHRFILSYKSLVMSQFDVTKLVSYRIPNPLSQNIC